MLAFRKSTSASVFLKKEGFTLFELLMVLAVISLGVALVSVSVGHGFSRSSEKAAAKIVASAFKLARERAISERQVYYAASDEGGVLIKSSGGFEKRLGLPEGTTVSRYSIEFYPTGRASGGQAAISRHAEDGAAGRALYIIKVETSSGRVSLKEGENAG